MDQPLIMEDNPDAAPLKIEEVQAGEGGIRIVQNAMLEESKGMKE